MLFCVLVFALQGPSFNNLCIIQTEISLFCFVLFFFKGGRKRDERKSKADVKVVIAHSRRALSEES